MPTANTVPLRVALVGNPNVGKSTLFNRLTGLRQHTGNWPGKTVAVASGTFTYKGRTWSLIDLPGTYSLYAVSPEETVTRDYIVDEKPDITLVVVDATCLERNLILALQVLALTQNILLCVNLVDEAARKGITVDTQALSALLGVPVVGLSARQRTAAGIMGRALDTFLMKDRACLAPSPLLINPDTVKKATETARAVSRHTMRPQRDLRIDRIVCSKWYGIPLMLALLGIVCFITIVASNYPSNWLAQGLGKVEEGLSRLLLWLHAPGWLYGLLCNGIVRTTFWVVAVMLPPMAIFFPFFTFLEDLGYLPRIAFNLDGCFRRACAHGKQALTMCMGLGCNAVGVSGCRIIESPRERLVAILTNVFIPCNGRFPTLIVMSGLFLGGATAFGGLAAAAAVAGTVLLGILASLGISWVLSKTLLRGEPSSFILELPPYRRPQAGQILVRSLLDRTFFVLMRAVLVAAPAGAVIWLLANLYIDGQNLFVLCSSFLDPFGKLLGMDGVILFAFLLGLPANEIVLPLILMGYMATGYLAPMDSIQGLGEILRGHGWTLFTGISVMLFSLMHFPCATTLLTIYKETKSFKWTALSFLLPTLCGITVCFLLHQAVNLVGLWIR